LDLPEFLGEKKFVTGYPKKDLFLEYGLEGCKGGYVKGEERKGKGEATIMTLA
jgi:hypothetical protein